MKVILILALILFSLTSSSGVMFSNSTSLNKSEFNNIVQTPFNTALSISNFFKENILYYTEKRKEYIKPYTESDIIHFPLLDKKKSIFNLLSHVNTHRTLDYYIDSVLKNGKNLSFGESEESYLFRVNFSEKLLNYRNFSNLDPDKQKENPPNDIEMTLIQPDLEMDITKIDLMLNITNINTFGNIIVGHDNGNVRVFQVQLKTEIKFEEVQVDEYFEISKDIFLSNVMIENILNDCNEDKGLRYILFQDSDSIIYLFKFNDDKKAKRFEYLKFQDLKSIFPKDTITGFYYNPKKSERLVLSYSQNGIAAVNTKNPKEVLYLSSFPSSIKTDPHSSTFVPMKNVIEIKEVANNLFLLIKDYGIKSLNLNQLANNLIEFNNFDLTYTNIVSLEALKSIPYSTSDKINKYLGVLVNTTQNGQSEFFLELKLNVDENNNYNISRSELYSIFLNDNRLSSMKFQTRGVIEYKSYIYLFDLNSNSLIVIPKSFAGDSPSSIFKIKIGELTDQELETDMFIINDDNENYIGIYNFNSFYLVKTAHMTDPKIGVLVNSPGIYDIAVHTYTEDCPGMDHSAYRKCRVNLTYRLNAENINNFLAQFYNLVTVVNILFLITMALVYNAYYRQHKRVMYYPQEMNSVDNSAVENNISV